MKQCKEYWVFEKDGKKNVNNASLQFLLICTYLCYYFFIFKKFIYIYLYIYIVAIT